MMQRFIFSLKNVIVGGKLIRVSKLNGKKVITANAYTLGEVEGAHVDTD